MQVSYIKQLDTELFFFINRLHHPILDSFFELVSLPYTWIPFYLVIIYLLYKNYSFTVFLYILLSFGVLILLSDKGSVLIFKNTVMRYRPCHNLEFGHLVYLVNNKCGGKYGFVSSHAANFFALATLIHLFLKRFYKNIGLVTFFAAILVSYSRIYLGVHYPLDVMVGGLYGIITAIVVFLVFKKIVPIKNN
jgi:undecaprenyl-diphosphatase